MQKGCILTCLGFRIGLCPNRLGDCYRSPVHSSILTKSTYCVIRKRTRLGLSHSDKKSWAIAITGTARSAIAINCSPNARAPTDYIFCSFCQKFLLNWRSRASVKYSSYRWLKPVMLQLRVGLLTGYGGRCHEHSH